MEFSFDINTILPLEITILNGDYRILNHGYAARISATDKLTSIIEAIGEASYKAQGLPGPVTTARKFRISDHRLYVVKDSSDNKTLGSVVGFLKVGAKHLYVHDSHGQVHERTPLCLLDFYVHESKQRSGYGKKLFNVMLEFEKCNAHELAIDRPSNKCLGFLQKHYNLSSPIRQVNNFVVYNAFFNVKPTIAQNRRLSASKQRQELTSWLLPSEIQRHRPFSEQNDNYRNNRLRSVADENAFFNKPKQTTNIVEERKPYSAFAATNYSSQINRQTTFNEIKKPDDSLPPAPYIPRTYTNLFSENNPFPSLQRYNTNPVISTSKFPTEQPYTYKDYHAQSSAVPHRTIDKYAEPEPLTSLYTFPSLTKPNTNWRRTYQQPSTIDASSSAWRLFGVQRLLD